jgi:hypothetical protein
MTNLYARAIFFVEDTERALRHYVEQLGFTKDWAFEEDGRVYVCQVSLFGFELILQQAHGATLGHPGHGRVFIGLEDDQREPLLKHIEAKKIQTERRDWGRPTLVITDLDHNELYIWDWPDKARPNSG